MVRTSATLGREPLPHITAEFDAHASPDRIRAALFDEHSTFTAQLIQWGQGEDMVAEPFRKASDGKTHRRVVRFMQRIDNPLSPKKTAPCTWDQAYYIADDGSLVVQTSSELRELPYADAWTMVNRWVFKPAREGACRVTMSMDVVFKRHFVWQGKVASEAVKAAKKGAARTQSTVLGFIDLHSREELAKLVARLSAEDEDGGAGTRRTGRRSSVEQACALVAVEQGGHSEHVAAAH